MDVWFDKRQLNFGDQWHASIEVACESSRVLLPVLTPRWRVVSVVGIVLTVGYFFYLDN